MYASNTYGAPAVGKYCMLETGNFCAFGNVKKTEANPYWCAGTGGNPGAYAELGLDGNFYIRAYHGAVLATNPKKAWVY